jgi:RimJ/RimL family protein N-acetyltransferase
MNTTILQTERLTLRRLSTDDAEFMLALLNDPAFIRNVGDRAVRTAAEAQAYIANGPVASYQRFGFGLYLAARRDTGAPLGVCGLLKRDALDDVDIGFAFLPPFRSRGYAVESAGAVKTYAREVLGLSRLVAIVLPDNHGSIRVLDRIGFRFERMVRLSEGEPELCLYASGAAPGPHR